MWSDLAPVGRSATSGGYFRQPFTQPERELADWFREQASARGLALESDDTGNLLAGGTRTADCLGPAAS